MNAERWTRVRELFYAALDLAPDQRDAFVARACGGDSELSAEVRALLRADADDGPDVPSFAAPPVPADLTGSTLAGFRVVRRIGTGGMGAVFEARQERPQRTVALKTLAVRFPSERARRRFEDEAEIVGRLRHPAIAQVLAAGTARAGDDDVPWFAMELVEEPRAIDLYVREEQLDLRAILALFAGVCDAVHYAHQHGVIHRDLKPANVLVDRHGRVKLIDFGIARLVDRDAVARCTRTGEILGTLAYMSPERLLHADRGDDVPSDVYALGVMLYELVAGRSPFALDTLPPARVVETLCAADPPPPSRVAPRVPVELDWITAKAMAREPRRRYASAAELAHDLERFARHDVVVAGPPSPTYRLRKLAWRHRVLLGAAALAFVAVTVGLVIALLGWQRVAAAEQAAQRRADLLAEVNRFQEDILFGAQDTEKGSDVRLVDAIDRVVAALEGKRFSAPVVEIGLRRSAGASYLAVGRLQDAERQLLRARVLLEQHAGEIDRRDGWDVLVSNDLSLVYDKQGRHEESEREARRALAEKLALYGPDSLAVAAAHSNLAVMLVEREAWEEALAFATAAHATFARAHGEGNHRTIHALTLRATILAGMRQDAEADEVLDRAQALADRNLHPDHPARLEVLGARAQFLHRRRRLPECVRVQEELAAARERVQGPNHPATLSAWCTLAAQLYELERFADAEAACRRAIAGWETIGVRGGFDYLATRQNLIGALRRQGRAADAEPIAREQRSLASATLPAGHWLLGVVTKEHGACLRELGRFAEAEPLLLHAHGLLAEAVGPSDRRTQRVVTELVALYEAWPDATRAAEWRARLPDKQ
ncbi:MAG TPA: serine/threonine-protein kinase [Planctomycetota bacterium]|nr:serine/threonine-protein kinase [Planctomycetota bacterium]